MNKKKMNQNPKNQSKKKTKTLKKGREENKPLEVIGDFVFETSRRVDLPLQKLLLEPIASNLTQSLTKNPKIHNHH